MIDASSCINGISNQTWIGDIASSKTNMISTSLDSRSELKEYPFLPVGPHSFSSDTIPPVKKPRTTYSPTVVSPRFTVSTPSIYSSRPTNFQELISGFQIQQRLDELSAKEKSLYEERQILTEQLARLRQNQQPNFDINSAKQLQKQFNFEINASKQPNQINGNISHNGHNLKRTAPSDENLPKSPVETEVLSVLSPASQKVLQQVLHNNSKPTQDQVVKQSIREKVSLLSNDSPYKPTKNRQNYTHRRRSLYIPVETSNSNLMSKQANVETSPQSNGSDGEQSDPASPPTCPSPEQRLNSLSFSDPKSISSLQKLSRRVKIVMKPSGQIFPRQKVSHNVSFDPDRNSPPPTIINPTTVENPTKQSEEIDITDSDNWLPWE